MAVRVSKVARRWRALRSQSVYLEYPKFGIIVADGKYEVVNCTTHVRTASSVEATT